MFPDHSMERAKSSLHGNNQYIGQLSLITQTVPLFPCLTVLHTRNYGNKHHNGNQNQAPCKSLPWLLKTYSAAVDMITYGHYPDNLSNYNNLQNVW